MPRRRLGLPLLLMLPAIGAAQEGDDWTRRKCALYADAWEAALSWTPPDGLGAEFLGRHEAFLASGCEGPHDVCPRSPEETALADLLVVMSMSEGMASTFAPFGCPG